ncbi:MAG: DJ-1/PfpI family protein [Chloroflexia bacterium]|nr:DJ-1/PfpI family protein [Chloroflexia bacterium]
MTDSRLRNVGILIFDEVEVLDFCGPFEVFSIARAPGATGDEGGLFRALTIAERAETIRCRGGLLVQPHHTVDDHPDLDVLLVPGGQGTRRERENPRLLRWIAEQDQRTEITASVCTGSLLLAAAELLAGHRATTHWAAIDLQRTYHPDIETVDDERFVDEGHLVTSAGVSAGIDMALHLVARLHGPDVAGTTARQMEYSWDG